MYWIRRKRVKKFEITEALIEEAKKEFFKSGKKIEKLPPRDLEPTSRIYNHKGKIGSGNIDIYI